MTQIDSGMESIFMKLTATRQLKAQFGISLSPQKNQKRPRRALPALQRIGSWIEDYCIYTALAVICALDIFLDFFLFDLDYVNWMS